MMNINDVLMRRGKAPTPVKKKRVASSQKKITSTSSAKTMLRFSKPLNELSERTTTKSAPSKGPASPASGGASVSSESPQTAGPTRQAYLDLGQKDFGRHVTCRKCGLLYTAGEEEDEKEHRRFCRDRQRGVVVPKWKNERVLKTYSDEDARIIEIRGDDAPLHVKKLMEVKELLDDALGFVEDEVFLQRGNFLFVQSKQIVGCVTVERIAKAMVLEHDVASSNAAVTSTASTTAPAVLGICQLWVHPQHRGKKIATRLVDMVREKFIYGLLIAKQRLAFAQPTRNGLAFATRYVSPHRVLVYGNSTPSESTNTTTS